MYCCVVSGATLWRQTVARLCHLLQEIWHWGLVHSQAGGQTVRNIYISYKTCFADIYCSSWMICQYLRISLTELSATLQAIQITTVRGTCVWRRGAGWHQLYLSDEAKLPRIFPESPSIWILTWTSPWTPPLKRSSRRSPTLWVNISPWIQTSTLSV